MLNPIDFGKLSFYFNFSQGLFYFFFDFFVHSLVVQYYICDFSCFLQVIKEFHTSFTLLWSERMLHMVWILNLLRLALWLNIWSVPYPLIWKVHVSWFFHIRSPTLFTLYSHTPSQPSTHLLFRIQFHITKFKTFLLLLRLSKAHLHNNFYLTYSYHFRL